MLQIFGKTNAMIVTIMVVDTIIIIVVIIIIIHYYCYYDYYYLLLVKFWCVIVQEHILWFSGMMIVFLPGTSYSEPFRIFQPYLRGSPYPMEHSIGSLHFRARKYIMAISWYLIHDREMDLLQDT